MSRPGRFVARHHGTDSVEAAPARLRAMWRAATHDFLEMSCLEFSSPNCWIMGASASDVGASEYSYGASVESRNVRIDEAFPQAERAEIRRRLRAVARTARREERLAIGAWIEHHSSSGSLVWQMSVINGGREARIEFLDAESVTVSTRRGRQRRTLRRLADLADDPGLYLVACRRHPGRRGHGRLHFTTLDGTPMVLIIDIECSEHASVTISPGTSQP